MLTNVLTNTVALDRLLQHAQDGIFVMNSRRQYVLFNKALEQLTGYTDQEITKTQCLCVELLKCKDEHGRSLSDFLCPAKALLDGDRQASRLRLQIQRRDGSQLWVDITYTLVPGPANDGRFVLGVVRNISDARAREIELLQQIAAMRQRAQEHGGQLPPRSSAAASTAMASAGPAASRLTGAAPNPCDSLRLDPLLADCERKAILRALEAASCQRNKAASMMGISRSRLYRRMEALGINPKEPG